jgi:hypothetical protein
MGRGAPLTLKVGDSPRAMRAAVLAMTRADSEVRRDVAARMRSTMGPVWKTELAQRLTGWSMEAQMIMPGARIGSGNPAQIVAASSRRKVGNGLIPDRHWAGYEYGASRDDTSEVTRGGTSYQRHTKRHLPARRANGRVIGPTVRAVLPRIAAFWTQSVVKAFLTAAEKRN